MLCIFTVGWAIVFSSLPGRLAQDPDPSGPGTAQALAQPAAFSGHQTFGSPAVNRAVFTARDFAALTKTQQVLLQAIRSRGSDGDEVPFILTRGDFLNALFALRHSKGDALTVEDVATLVRLKNPLWLMFAAEAVNEISTSRTKRMKALKNEVVLGEILDRLIEGKTWLTENALQPNRPLAIARLRRILKWLKDAGIIEEQITGFGDRAFRITAAVLPQRTAIHTVLQNFLHRHGLKENYSPVLMQYLRMQINHLWEPANHPSKPVTCA